MKTVTEVVEVTLTAGQSTNNVKMSLPTGICKRVGVVISDGSATENVNISLIDMAGNDIVKSHSYKFWEQRQGGDFFDSLKPVNFNCGKEIKPTLTAPTPLAGDITFQFMFLIAQEEK